MKKLGLLFIVLSLVTCTSSNDSSEIVETSTTVTTESSNNENDSTTTTSNDVEENEIVDSYIYDKEKMSPFTGLELTPEIWLSSIDIKVCLHPTGVNFME